MKARESAVPPFVRARQQQRCVEHYWLCDECAKVWTLAYDQERGVALSPLEKRAARNVPITAAGVGAA